MAKKSGGKPMTMSSGGYGSKSPKAGAPMQMKKRIMSATNPGYTGVSGPKSGGQSSSC